MEYVSKGLTNKEIGEILFISNNTVKKHVKSIIKNLGVKNRTRAVYVAVKQNIVM